MIRDRLRNGRLYEALGPEFRVAFRLLARRNWRRTKPGRYPVGRTGAYAIVQDYLTKPPRAGVLECHRRFVDIQYLVRGIERIGVCGREDCRKGRYDAGRDFQPLEGAVERLTLRAGEFAVFFPHDAHMPGLCAGRRRVLVRKVVLKVPVRPRGAGPRRARSRPRWRG